MLPSIGLPSVMVLMKKPLTLLQLPSYDTRVPAQASSIPTNAEPYMASEFVGTLLVPRDCIRRREGGGKEEMIAAQRPKTLARKIKHLCDDLLGHGKHHADSTRRKIQKIMD